MSNTNSVATFLGDIVHYATHHSHAHRMKHALEGLTDEDLGYSPVPGMRLDWDDERRWPCVQTPRRIIGHMILAATQYANGLVGESGEEWSGEATRKRVGAVADSADGLVAALETALARLEECCATLTDAELLEPARETWDGTRMKGFVVIDGAVLHTAWHLGQVAMLIDWHRAQADGRELAAPSGPPGGFDYPGDRDWSDLHLDTRTEAILRIERAAFGESPAHCMRRVVEGVTERELAWRPFPDIENPWFCRAMWTLVLHTWAPKIVYIDHGFGERKLDYGEEGHISGCGWGETNPAKQLGALDRAHEWLVDHVGGASDEALDRVNPMHINVPMTGWQVVACMAQHDAWHAGQLSIMRDVYAALAGGAA